MKTLNNLLRAAMTSAVLSAALVSAPVAYAAQDAGINPTEKVGLMASALSLKDQGDYAAAFEKATLLREIAPNDPSVNRLYNELVEEMEAEGIPFDLIATDESGSDESTVAPTATTEEAAPVVSPDANVKASISQAQKLAAEGSYPEAITLLNQAKANSTDPATQAQIDDLIASYILDQESSYVETAMENSREDMARAEELADEGRYSAAYELLDASINRLPVSTGTEDLIETLENTKKEMLLEQAEELAQKGEGNDAMAAFQEYQRDPSTDASIQDQAKDVQKMVKNPYAYNIREISPGFVAEYQEVQDLLVKGRAQFVNGDYEGARQTFAQVETISPENVEAKAFLYEIAERSTNSGHIDRTKTRAEMLNQVSRAWQQPRVYVDDRGPGTGGVETTSPVLKKLETIVIPRVTFTGTSLSRAVQSLSEMSEEFDRNATSAETRGVNMVVSGQGGTDRQVNFSVRNLSLLRILDIVGQQTGYQWDVVDQVVEFQPSDQKGGNNRLQRAIIPISKGTLDLILDIQSASGGGSSSVADDPFAAPTGPSGPATDDRQDALVNFFEASGIEFRNITGASIVNRGSRLLVNQTSRNIEEIRQTLRELDITDQVEIEAKFMEVVQGNLDELAFEWNAGNQGNAVITRSQSTSTTRSNGSNRSYTGTSSGSNTVNTIGPPPTSSFIGQDSTTYNSTVGNNSSFNSTTSSFESPQFDSYGNPRRDPTKGYNGSMNTLASIFGTTETSEQGTISSPSGNTPFSVAPGTPANALDLGADIISNFFTQGVIGNFDISMVMRAVSRMEGSDLLSAPRVTVMSGKSANIVVAQEFIYPTSYGEPTVTASSGSSDDGGGGGGGAVALASGVPEDFETRNLGVELTVTPTVEPNDKINLALQPRVTEFEGYVSYGGPNIALTDQTSVQSPSGYFQPIFSTRTVETEVTVFDGATVVLGGLTREEVQEYKQKIPILGDIPLIGRLFRSEGETSQKRNLIIFVTANLISPGGSPANQSFQGTESNSLFQNPTVISPGGILSRDKQKQPVEE
ncbi:hypothetical protein [Puniceicoccus vermicola]|uniref:Type II/III secretion system secretin-like domain-containing protein n=1 Tax=Puniceicoccus vermicola TaxID=388746 RepID=A0A7X1AZ17_9BACT|nr:hypothetical protein [Puniceicoccus vermicola]MBC2601470.1 hypothetical protein [Puniceicoccus vermicola]